MTVITIGSYAARLYLRDFREPKDYDCFSDSLLDEQLQGLRVEKFWHPLMAEYWKPSEVRPATLDELFTIKHSHAYWDLHGTWDKHMNDMLAFQRKGAKLIPELHDLLYKVWEEQHGAKRVDLNMDKGDFFDDAVRRIYDHDSIHYSVAYGDRPIYESVFKDGQSVAMDMRKVWALPFADQVRLFREEIYATALERWVIPSNYRCSPLWAYHQAVKKTVVSLTKGKSAQFIVTNYDIYRKPDIEYVKHHKSKSDLLIRLESK